MAANSSLDLTSLDFQDLKERFKTFMKSQDRFKDYDFEGPNISVLLDVLTYNTYINAFNSNMQISEAFLDSAQLRDSIVSLAKELNYMPRSFRSAVAFVDVTVATGDSNVALLTMQKGTTFTGKSGSNNYTFQTDQNLVASGNNGTFLFSNVALYEGISANDSFVISYASEPQKFVLSNPNIDTQSLEVVTIENQGSDLFNYQFSQTLLDLTSNSTAYFLQAVEDGKYQVFFGDNIVGRKPADGSVVVASYRISSGELPNGISKFTPDSTIQGYSNVFVGTVASAVGGAISESNESVRFNAPRAYSTQERAITDSDYETLLRTTFPEIVAVVAYGGEEVVPPQYGKVFISIQLAGFDGTPASKVAQYKAFLSGRRALAIQPQFVDPDHTYISVSTAVTYNINETDITADDVTAYVISAIQTYNLQELVDFKSTLLYSRFVGAIDDSHPSVVSNETDVLVMKKLTPRFGVAQNFNVSFGMSLVDDLVPETRLVHPASAEHAISSSRFVYRGQSVVLEDDGLGAIWLASTRSDGYHRMFQAGKVDYASGAVTLSSLLADSYQGDSIRLYGRPSQKDVTVSGNVILEIPSDEIQVTVTAARI